MSASLVGSEMCIRDRAPPVAVRQGPPTPYRAEATRPTTAHVRKRGKPVSYTHLTLPTICSV
eukprot:476413-Alexandrium_andersonii.AAC.1